MFREVLKKTFYTGIGIAAVAVEKTGEIVDTLQEKGVQAVKEGRIINEELRRKLSTVESNIGKVIESLEKMSKEELEHIREKLSEVEIILDKDDHEAGMDAETVLSSLENMSREEIEAVRAKIEEIQKNRTEKED